MLRLIVERGMARKYPHHTDGLYVTRYRTRVDIVSTWIFIKPLCLRFDLANEEERKAYEYLQNRDRSEYSSYAALVSRAVNDFYERRARLENDPYFETREKEDAFVERILSALQYATPVFPASMDEEENVDDQVLLGFLKSF